ncbi:hypothetical protein PRK78_003215 [Emydomyces testavorans]|uniref:Uncharacterized protein n=1 Tax=Emydomyces testavorans TaxID=2070801 RepID=A0AAF0II69_9EURO|nr:hypothetical protein PRK78_003215 [Emydomyces testavorans]
MAEKLLPSPSVLESGVDTMILDMAPMLPDIEITEQDLNLFALSNTLQANIAMPENQEHLQTTIAQARAQLQTRMDAMHNSSPAGKQSADSQTYPELVVPEVEAAQNVFEFDGECQDDYLSERNETFETMKLDFESKKKPSLEEQILFQKAQNNELQRLNRLKSQREKREELSLNLLENHNPQVDISFASGPSLNHEQYELFCSENENGGVNQSFLATERQTKSRPKSKGKQANSGSNIASKDKRQNAALGFDAFRQSNGNKRSNGKRVRKPDSAGGKKGGKWKSKSSKQKQKRQRVNLNFDSLFSSNIINAAKANVKKQELPKSSAKAKDKALKELIANIPHADPKVVSTDKSAIMAAIVKFSKRPKADGNGSWLHPDMKTSLFHYQVM